MAAASQVTVLKGGAHGLTGTGAVSFKQNTAGVPGTAEQNDFFGRSTALVDTDHDGRAELYAGAPGENVFDGAVRSFRNPGAGSVAAGSVSCGAGTLRTVAADAELGLNFAH
ncbi:FG-GAP repeat protein [Streptomyces sp. TLI_185]|uniref:FG-GAP repeat protein n=1 Tax=Streptomyces sp. TLI_185 TaxID=2485151 RepID=UPI0021A50AFE|nr:FG-GAP repeat protein [Streptomyces sp. TLI_185]